MIATSEIIRPLDRYVDRWLDRQNEMTEKAFGRVWKEGGRLEVWVVPVVGTNTRQKKRAVSDRNLGFLPEAKKGPLSLCLSFSWSEMPINLPFPRVLIVGVEHTGRRACRCCRVFLFGRRRKSSSDPPSSSHTSLAR